MALAALAFATARRPLMISDGGVRSCGAEGVVAACALQRGIPITETISGKRTVVHDHPA